MEIRSQRLTISPLLVEDVYLMRNWGKHDNPLLEDYNFPLLSDREIVKWYNNKTRPLFNKYYGVRNEKKDFIGYLGIKDIKIFRKFSTLGIVIDANHMEKGYGIELLDCFIDYYFTELKMKYMILEVAEFNKRAYRVYEKIGFVKDGYYLDDFFNQRLNLKNIYYIEAKSSFVIDGHTIYNYIYKMTLTKKRFYELRSKRNSELE